MAEKMLGNGEPTPVWMKVGGVVAATLVLAAAAPVIWAAVSAGMGIVALGVTVVVGGIIYKAIPLIGQKVENRILAARKSEARQNPVEQLQNYLLDKAKQLQSFKSAVAIIGGQIETLRDKIEDRKKSKPGSDVTKQERALESMRKAYQILLNKANAGERALEELREAIDQKKFEWDFAKAGQEAMEHLNGLSGEDLLNEMLADEAFSSVRDNFNKVFAELELEATKLNAAKELSFGEERIDVSDINIPTRAKERIKVKAGGSPMEHLEV